VSRLTPQVVVKDLEDKIIEIYGKVEIERAWKESLKGGGADVLLNNQMLHAVHMDTICHFLGRQSPSRLLHLSDNRLDDEALKKLAGALRGNSTLQVLTLEHNKIGLAGSTALINVLATTKLKEVKLKRNAEQPWHQKYDAATKKTLEAWRKKPYCGVYAD